MWALLIACRPSSVCPSTKLDTKHPWVMGIQVCSNEGPRPFPTGDNYEIAEIHRRNLKFFFSRTTGPISNKLGTKHPWVMGIQVCSNEGPNPFPRGYNSKIAKYKNSSSPELLGQFQPNLAQSILGWRGKYVCSYEEPFNSHKGNNRYLFLSINDMMLS